MALLYSRINGLDDSSVGYCVTASAFICGHVLIGLLFCTRLEGPLSVEGKFYRGLALSVSTTDLPVKAEQFVRTVL